jgi:hypothetical protein
MLSPFSWLADLLKKYVEKTIFFLHTFLTQYSQPKSSGSGRGFPVQLGSADRRRGKERRRGGDRRTIKDRRNFEGRRSGEDRRKVDGPRYTVVKRQEIEGTDEEPKCQRCINILGELRVLILECPLPEKNCVYKKNFEIIHYVTYPSVRVENGSAVVASSPETLLSPSIILIRPDPILKENHIYFIEVTNRQTF